MTEKTLVCVMCGSTETQKRDITISQVKHRSESRLIETEFDALQNSFRW